MFWHVSSRYIYISVYEGNFVPGGSPLSQPGVLSEVLFRPFRRTTHAAKTLEG